MKALLTEVLHFLVYYCKLVNLFIYLLFIYLFIYLFIAKISPFKDEIN